MAEPGWGLHLQLEDSCGRNLTPVLQDPRWQNHGHEITGDSKPGTGMRVAVRAHVSLCVPQSVCN